MFVRHLEIEGKVGFRKNIELPTWGQVESAIRALDQMHVRAVIICDKPGGTEMLLSGGGARYRIGVLQLERDFFYFNNPEFSNDLLMLNHAFGGDAFPESQMTAQVKDAIEAAQEFFKTGELNRKLNWVRANSSLKSE